MVSLSTPRTGGPLVTRLASSPRPAIVQEPVGPEAARAPLHGEVDQRIELSGAVAVNWAAKTAGLLGDEGVDDGAAVLVDLPAHWLSHAVVLGALVAGAELSPASGAAEPWRGPAPDAVLTDRPERWTDPATAVFAVALPRGLAPELGGDADLDPGVVDVAAEIRAQPDALSGPVDHVRADMLDDVADVYVDAEAAATGTPDADAVRPRLTLADVRDALAAWDAGRAVTVRP